MLPNGIEATDWLQLPEPILHPDAAELVAMRCEHGTELLAALLDGEVYRSPLDDEGELVLWPWYPEQDEELRGAALRRSAELGAGMPRFLDEPYESAFYLRFTGEDAFVELAAELGIEPGELYLERIPVVEPPSETVVIEGLETTHPWLQRLEHIEDLLGELDWMQEGFRALGLQRIRRAVTAYANALSGIEAPRRPLWKLSEIDDEELEPPGELHFERVFAVEGGALVQVSGSLVALESHGDEAAEHVIRVVRRVPGDVVFAGGRFAVIDAWDELSAVDLTDGSRALEELDAVREFGGPLSPPSYLLPPGYDGPLFDDVRSPCGRFSCDGYDVWRLEDGIVLGAPFGDPWDTPDVPGLLSFEDLSTRGQRQTEIDGVTFTHRTPTGFRVRDEQGVAFARHGGGWRAYVDGTLLAGERAVASLGVGAHSGAFSADGERLFVLTDTDVVEIEWRDEPRVVCTTPLFRIASAIEDFRD